MCEPTTIAVLTMAASAAAAYQQIQQAEFQAGVAEQNAQLAEGQSALALQRGAIAKGVERMKGSQAIGEARAQQGTSGIDLTSSSSLDVISDAAMLNELDAQTIGNNAAREAWGYQVQATNERAQARSTRTAGRLGAAATLIGGAAQAGSGYAAAKYRASAAGGTSAGAVS